MSWLLATLAVAHGASSLAIPHEKYVLDNGLQVILAEDHSIPFVQVNIWYAVGSKDEVAGRSGFAHLFEHLMFQGSQHHDLDYFVPLQKIGAEVNGTTNTDRTNYFEGVPSEYLPLALWLESDRMGWLLPALTPEKLTNQKDVVRNERRQNYEMRPYGEAWVWLNEALYPDGHPYHIPTIGRHEDIEAATLEDVSAFFRTWYLPNNATLTICGDFDPGTARTLVNHYFGAIPAGPEPTVTTAAPVVLETEKVVRKTDDVPLSKVWIAWHSPAILTPGDADLDVVASVLSDGKESRLYRRLVQEKQIAKDISARQGSAKLGSAFVIQATAAPGHTTDEVVAEVDAVLAELLQGGVRDDEVRVAVTNYEAGFLGNLQTIGAKANTLSMYNTLTGDPDYLDEDLARYLAVTPTSALEAARAWLKPGARVVLHVGPAAQEVKP